MKKCSQCRNVRPLEDFTAYAIKGQRQPFEAKRCRRCRIAYARYKREWEKKRRALGLPIHNHNTKIQKRRHRVAVRKSMLMRGFGITIAQYEAMFRNQNGGCAICCIQNIDGKMLVVDHDHKTGKVRSLLCRTCNGAIGFVKESIDLLYRAADYLEKHSRTTGVVYR